MNRLLGRVLTTTKTSITNRSNFALNFRFKSSNTKIQTLQIKSSSNNNIIINNKSTPLESHDFSNNFNLKNNNTQSQHQNRYFSTQNNFQTKRNFNSPSKYPQQNHNHLKNRFEKKIMDVSSLSDAEKEQYTLSQSLSLAMNHGNLESVQKLIGLGAKLTASYHWSAVETNKVEIMKFFLTQDRTGINFYTKTSAFRTPLHIAAKFGFLAMTQLLAETGIWEIDVTDDLGKS